LKVPDVGGSDAISEFERACADKQIRKRDTDTLRLTLSVNLSGTEGDPDRHRLDGNACQEIVKKPLAAAAALGSIRTGDAVREF